MSTKIIVSYDGTANEDDAIALGRLLAKAGAEVALAYVRHTHEPDRDRETLAQAEAQELLDRGAELLGDPSAARHVVTDRSTPEGLRGPGRAARAPSVVVFCSDSHTAKGHVADRQLRRAPARGRPHGRRDRARRTSPRRRRARASSRSSPSATATAARARPPSRSPARSARPSRRSLNEEADLLVIDSRPEAESRPGRAQRLGRAPDRDLHLRGARAAARRRARVRRSDRGGRRLERHAWRFARGRASAAGPAARPCRAGSARAPQQVEGRRRARWPAGPVHSPASRAARRRAVRRAAHRGGTVSWRACQRAAEDDRHRARGLARAPRRCRCPPARSRAGSSARPRSSAAS